jgi:hypothetical protein
MEASVRIAMFLAAQRLEAYRDREGEYPASLADAGAETSFGYSVDEQRYRLEGRAGNARIVLSSTDDHGEFLGNSRDLIQRGVR